MKAKPQVIRFLVLQNNGEVKEYCESKFHIKANGYKNKRNIEWEIYQLRSKRSAYLPAAQNPFPPNVQAPPILGNYPSQNSYPPNIQAPTMLDNYPSQNSYPPNVQIPSMLDIHPAKENADDKPIIDDIFYYEDNFYDEVVWND